MNIIKSNVTSFIRKWPYGNGNKEKMQQNKPDSDIKDWMKRWID